MPGFSRNCLRTSSMMAPAAVPTASIASEANKNGSAPPMKSPTNTQGSDSRNSMAIPSLSSSSWA